MERKIIVLLGTPGAGKGTQAILLEDKVNLPSISVGSLLRDEIAKKTKIGKVVEKIVSKGKLIDSKITEKILKNRLSKKDIKKGFILDGYPRKKDQINYLINNFSKNSDKLIIIYIDLTDKEIRARLTGRRNCSCGEKYHLKYKKPKKRGVCDVCSLPLRQRKDDNPKSVATRIKQFHKENTPIVKFFSKNNSLVKINGDQKIKKIHKDIMKILKMRKII